MEGFQVVSGGPLSTPLNGEVAVNGAKNSALKLMAASYVEDGLALPTPNPKAKPTLGKKPDFTETIPLKTQFQTPAVR